MFVKHLVFSMIFLLAVAGQASEANQSAGKKRSLEPKVVTLIENIDAKTESLDSVRARFVFTKEIALLKQPTVMEGDFFFHKGDGVKLAFDPEHHLTAFFTTDEEVITINPETKTAFRVSVTKRQSRYAQKLLSQKIKSLTKYFDVEVAEATVDGKPSYQLTLNPAKRRLKKKFQTIQLWVNHEHMMYRAQITMKEGDTYDVSLTDQEVNVAIPEDTFKVDIPTDYTVGDTFKDMLTSGAAF